MSHTYLNLSLTQGDRAGHCTNDRQIKYQLSREELLERFGDRSRDR
ncbi:hypothetical protein PMG71_12815 [Roseofilum sp. BLCC_M154]|uniref:Uncharacterized protein n=1 Tax=Roseofilum acuticapitatum BLCC-M154 TaxID=3022444 RepID=A0ABT7AV88_9CYAN|nr:hypothetical protein [Roseofilum acuticapitatum]MDJ1170314.1 hypothetical protein [Roseofilum acuticapitatum BLCC-M154]